MSPIRPAGLLEKEHYQGLFDKLGVDYCFADKDDPLCEQKIIRGKYAWFLRIPHLRIASTTSRVERGAPEIEDSGCLVEDDYESAWSVMLPFNDSFLQI